MLFHVDSVVWVFLLSQSDQIPSHVLEQQTKIKSSIHSHNRRISKDNSLTVREKLSPSLQRLFDIANEKGVSSWLTVIPIKAHGFDLHKGDFRDSLCLRYGWNPPSLPSTCSCGTSFSIDHALNCPFGGFPSIRHNGIRDFTATFMRVVFGNVVTEPILQTLFGETLLPRSAIRSDDARLDIKTNGFWGCGRQSAFFDDFQSNSTFLPEQTLNYLLQAS